MKIKEVKNSKNRNGGSYLEDYTCWVCAPDGEIVSNGVSKIGWASNKAITPTTI